MNAAPSFNACFARAVWRHTAYRNRMSRIAFLCLRAELRTRPAVIAAQKWSDYVCDLAGIPKHSLVPG